MATTARGGLAAAGLVAVAACLTGCEPPGSLLPGESGCQQAQCHARIEHAHYGGDPLDCVDCHGGDRAATTIEAAHVTTTVSFNPSSPGAGRPGGQMLRDATLDVLDALDPEVLQFLNPADYRVASRTCGSATRGGGNCHTRIVDTSLLSTHATLSGQLAGGLYFGGIGDREARFAVRDVADAHAGEHPGTTDSLAVLPGAAGDLPVTGQTAAAYYVSMGQLCVECHLSRDGAHVPGKYTSSGCNACHLLTADDGRALTTDPTQDPDEGGHGARHRLTNLIPDSQCNHCHHAHLQRGLLAQGVRERSEPEGDAMIGGTHRGVEDPEHAVPWSAENYVRHEGSEILYGKPFPFYISDEDGTNDVDETPPDIHTAQGMACIDCHVVAELHGEGHLAVRREFETRVRCETCHGAPQGVIDPGALPFRRSLSRVGGSADNEDVIALDEETGELMQLGKLDQRLHPVTQIARRLDPAEARFNPRTRMGCGLHAGDAAFRARLLELLRATDPAEVDTVFPGLPEGATLPDDLGTRDGRVECFTCHNAWTLNCFGCHVVRDDRELATNRITGRSEPGRITNFGLSVVSDALVLGFGTRGRITPMVGTSIFFSHLDASGSVLVDAAPLVTSDAFSGDGNQHNPVHHHTVRREPRDCQGCHPRADGATGGEEALARAVGFGTGAYLFVDGTGRTHVLDAVVGIDFDGDGRDDDPLTTPLGTEARSVRPIAASTHLSIIVGAPGPGPLDAVTINRLLSNPVVPQRP